MKLLPILLLIYFAGLGQSATIIKPNVIVDTIMVAPCDTVYVSPEECKSYFQTLEHINDSLRQKLNLALEYAAYACPIVEGLQLKTRAGALMIKLKDKGEMIEAIRRYNKRYSK